MGDTGVRVKICGLSRPEDARHAVAAGAAYLGTVLTQGFGRSVDPSVVAGFPDAVPRVAVLVNEPPERAAALARGAGSSVLQLHGSETPENVRSLRAAGDWTIWKALRVRRAEDLERGLDRFVAVVDGLLVDAFHPSAAGGAGVRFPWALLEERRSQVPPDVDLIVAGGLRPENVAEAVRRLRPDVVDVSSGVESDGAKDAGRIREFVREARS